MEYFINETVPAQCNCGQAVEKNSWSKYWVGALEDEQLGTVIFYGKYLIGYY